MVISNGEIKHTIKEEEEILEQVNKFKHLSIIERWKDEEIKGKKCALQ